MGNLPSSRCVPTKGKNDMGTQPDMDQLAVNTIRMLVVDAVQKAKSGHPGTPMDAAPAAYTLW